jgi:bifunctional UDP-N-acetylglucosamine pyrophosphorylase/glucosamine-1-phosphate N-acetyltransferase
VWWRDLQRQADELAALGKAGRLSVDPSANIAQSATLDASSGPIVIGERTKICAGAFIQGPVVIGPDCLIGNLAMVRGATRIGTGGRIGFAAEIKNSMIGERVAIGPQCFVADSKLEADAYLGAQVRTSNHRLDKRSVEVMVDGERVDTGMEKLGCLIGERAALGIQVIILPGREVAPDSLYAPRITIDKNLPAGRYRLGQQLVSF